MHLMHGMRHSDRRRTTFCHASTVFGRAETVAISPSVLYVLQKCVETLRPPPRTLTMIPACCNISFAFAGIKTAGYRDVPSPHCRVFVSIEWPLSSAFRMMTSPRPRTCSSILWAQARLISTISGSTSGIEMLHRGWLLKEMSQLTTSHAAIRARPRHGQGRYISA